MFTQKFSSCVEEHTAPHMVLQELRVREGGRGMQGSVLTPAGAAPGGSQPAATW